MNVSSEPTVGFYRQISFLALHRPIDKPQKKLKITMLQKIHFVYIHFTLRFSCTYSPLDIRPTLFSFVWVALVGRLFSLFFFSFHIPNFHQNSS